MLISVELYSLVQANNAMILTYQRTLSCVKQCKNWGVRLNNNLKLEEPMNMLSENKKKCDLVFWLRHMYPKKRSHHILQLLRENSFASLSSVWCSSEIELVEKWKHREKLFSDQLKMLTISLGKLEPNSFPVGALQLNKSGRLQ